MKIVEINSVDAMDRLRPAWNSLLSNSESDSVFLSFEWILAWCESFGANEKLNIFAVFDKNSLVAIIPTMIRNSRLRGFPLKEISFIENEEAGNADIIIRKGADKKRIIELLMSRLMDNENISLIHLRRIPCDSKNVNLICEFLNKNRIRYGIRASLQSPYILIDRPWQSFVEGMGSHFKKRLRAAQNKIEKSDKLSITNVKRFEQFCEIIPKLEEISEKSWLRKYREDMFGCARRKDFFVRLSEKASKQGWLSVWVMEWDKEAVAYEYHLVYKEHIYALRAGYSSKFSNLSPGFILESNIIQANFADYNGKTITYDLCGGKNFYKLRWTQNVRLHVDIMVFPSKLVGGLLWGLEFKLIEPVKKAFKKHHTDGTNSAATSAEQTGNIDPVELEKMEKTNLKTRYSVSDRDAEILASNEPLRSYFEACSQLVSDPRNACNWILNRLVHELRKSRKTITECPISPEQLASLINMIEDDKITSNISKNIFKKMFFTGRDPSDIVEEESLFEITDRKVIMLLAKEVIAKHPKEAEKYRRGDPKVVNFFVGQVMKVSEEKINVYVLREILEKTLETD